MGAVNVGLIMTRGERDHLADLTQAKVIGIGRAALVGNQGKKIGLGVTLKIAVPLL